MTNTLDYYFTTPSPWAYLATPRIIEIEKKYDLKINWKPCNLMEIFAKNGTAAVKDRPKPVQLNRLTELKRWSEYLNMHLTIQPKFFPVDPTISQKIIIIAQNNNINPSTIAFAFMKAVWAEGKDISNEETVKELCQHCNIDSTSIIEEANSAEINNQYVLNTNEAINKNVWGSPTFIYNNELFWGQDRIEFLERAIQNN
ncbi:MAG TPA: 2-hydroxychromene-2-carboxylate isomerase [Alphaproteobacteria bacterium]|nr:2-hydroxychromene-2-carboxylate isomerase [Alphaproteobacteria bacterium]